MLIHQPVRVQRSYVQKLCAPPSEVFPLLCPVREMEWVPGWNPVAVISQSGLAELDCIFITSDGGEETTWVTSKYDPKTFEMQLIRFTPGMTVGRIDVALSENETGGSDCRVTYAYTAMSTDGAGFVGAYSEEYFHAFMQAWEFALNDHLAQCRTLPGEGCAVVPDE